MIAIFTSELKYSRGVDKGVQSSGNKDKFKNWLIDLNC